MKKFINRAVTLFAVCGLISFVLFTAICQKEAPRTEQPPIAHLPQKVLFKTIYNSDNALDLIGFELHEDEPYDNGESKCATFNAIVRNLDPEQDNYKSICKDIVADIIKTCGEKDVRINIYDSFEAYKLSMDNEYRGRVLSTEEEQYADAHKIATYAISMDGDYYTDDQYYLSYYPNAGNVHTENELYQSL